jgi:hypothetical protein
MPVAAIFFVATAPTLSVEEVPIPSAAARLTTCLAHDPGVADNPDVEASRLRRTAIVAALTIAAMLAVYPAHDHGAASFWWVADMLLLFLTLRGHRWAGILLAFTTTVGAAVLLAAGAGQLSNDPRYFARGVALAVAALLLIQLRRTRAVA